MNGFNISRKTFLGGFGAAFGSAVLPAQAFVQAGGPIMRFGVASDVHINLGWKDVWPAKEATKRISRHTLFRSLDTICQEHAIRSGQRIIMWKAANRQCLKQSLPSWKELTLKM